MLAFFLAFVLANVISQPFPLVPNTQAKAESVQGDLSPIYTLLNGNIDYTNVNSSVGIDANQITSAASAGGGGFQAGAFQFTGTGNAIPLIVNGVPGQTEDIFEVKPSPLSTPSFGVNAAGSPYINGTFVLNNPQFQQSATVVPQAATSTQNFGSYLGIGDSTWGGTSSLTDTWQLFANPSDLDLTFQSVNVLTPNSPMVHQKFFENGSIAMKNGLYSGPGDANVFLQTVDNTGDPNAGSISYNSSYAPHALGIIGGYPNGTSAGRMVKVYDNLVSATSVATAAFYVSNNDTLPTGVSATLHSTDGSNLVIDALGNEPIYLEGDQPSGIVGFGPSGTWGNFGPAGVIVNNPIAGTNLSATNGEIYHTENGFGVHYYIDPQFNWGLYDVNDSKYSGFSVNIPSGTVNASAVNAGNINSSQIITGSAGGVASQVEPVFMQSGAVTGFGNAHWHTAFCYISANTGNNQCTMTFSRPFSNSSYWFQITPGPTQTSSGTYCTAQWQELSMTTNSITVQALNFAGSGCAQGTTVVANGLANGV